MEPANPLRVTQVIGRALESARKVLRDLDPAQVPASLRPVVAHSGALTPPLAGLLARELDALSWLRERSLEVWEGADVAVGAPDRASALFLVRPQGWELELGLVASGLGASAALSGGDRSERARAALERDLAAAREREQQARARAERAEASAREARRRAAEPARSERAEAARLEAELDRSRAEWERERAALASRSAGWDAEMAALREKLFRAEQDRAAMARALEEARGGGAWVGGDAVGLSILLDEVAAQARVVPLEAEGEVGEPAVGFVLPAGVRPDAPRAIDALLAHRGPLLVLVDGYNVGLMMAEGTPAEVRYRVSGVLERLAAIAPPAVRIVVAWDSSLAGGDAHRRGRVQVRFAGADEEADDVLVAMAGESAIPVVVISSDRGVRDRTGEVGALALWSEALVGWASERP
jgi:hypothetical protein